MERKACMKSARYVNRHNTYLKTPLVVRPYPVAQRMRIFTDLSVDIVALFWEVRQLLELGEETRLEVPVQDPYPVEGLLETKPVLLHHDGDQVVSIVTTALSIGSVVVPESACTEAAKRKRVYQVHALDVIREQVVGHDDQVGGDEF